MRLDDERPRMLAGGAFVGRVRELRELQAALAAAVAGRGGLWLVSGEAGIGKTRLAVEFASYAAASGAWVLWGRCPEDQGAPAYWPWIQILRTYARSCDPERLAAHVGAHAPWLAQVLPEMVDLVPATANRPSTAEHGRFHLFDAVATFLQAAARRQPLVLVFEDLHAADSSSLSLLDFTAAEIADAPLLVLGTYRERQARSLGNLARLGHRLPLRGLSRADVADLIHKGFGLTPSEPVLRRVFETTGGNPFLVNEVVRLLVAEGRMRELGPGGLSVPDGVRQTIRRRLEPMSDEAREVLAIAAVAGRQFSLALLERCSALPVPRIVEVLDDAAALGLLAPIHVDLGSYRFSHALIREALYADISLGQRLRIHRHVADALEELYAANLDAHVDEIATHLLVAAPTGLGDTAITYAVRAGRSAWSRLAYEHAAERFEQALRLIDTQADPDPAQRCRLLLDLGEAHMRAGRADAAKRQFRDAADIARDLGLAEELASAALGYGGQWSFTGETVDGTLVALLEEALRAPADLDDATHARLLARLADELYHADDPELAEGPGQRAVELARTSGDPAALGRALLARMYALWRPAGPYGRDQRLELDQQILDLAERSGDAELALAGRAWRVLDLLESGDVAGADTQISVFARTAADLRQPFFLWCVPVFRALRALMDGRFAEAERLADEALAAGHRIEGERELAQNAVLVHVVQTMLLQRERGEHGSAMSPPVPVKEAFEQFEAHPALRCAVAVQALDRGRETEARAHFEVLVAGDFRVAYRGEGTLMTLALAAELCARLGDATRAAALYRHLLPYAGRHVVIGHPAMGYLGALDWYLGLLAAATGRADDAVDHLRTAHAMHLRVGAMPWVARAQYELARVLQPRSRGTDAREAAELREAASRTATELGMSVLQHRIDDLHHAAAPSSAATSGRTAGVFRRDGEYWTVALGPEIVRVKDTKGMRYLQRLLADPDREFHVLDLAAASRRGLMDARAAAADGLALDGGSSAGPLLDARAKAAYHRRLRDLRADVDEAEALGDSARAARAQEEIDALVRELARAVGLGGRDRRAADAAERARVNVSRAIRSAIRRIADHSSALGYHLDSAVRTGTYCSYRPDPAAPPSWDL